MLTSPYRRIRSQLQQKMLTPPQHGRNCDSKAGYSWKKPTRCSLGCGDIHSLFTPPYRRTLSQLQQHMVAPPQKKMKYPLQDVQLPLQENIHPTRAEDIEYMQLKALFRCTGDHNQPNTEGILFGFVPKENTKMGLHTTHHHHHTNVFTISTIHWTSRVSI